MSRNTTRFIKRNCSLACLPQVSLQFIATNCQLISGHVNYSKEVTHTSVGHSQWKEEFDCRYSRPHGIEGYIIIFSTKIAVLCSKAFNVTGRSTRMWLTSTSVSSARWAGRSVTVWGEQCKMNAGGWLMVCGLALLSVSLPSDAWDADLELLDLVEEIPDTFYQFMSLEQVRGTPTISMVTWTSTQWCSTRPGSSP